MKGTLYIFKLTGFRRDLAARMRRASLDKDLPDFDSSYIHQSLWAYDKDGKELWHFSDSEYHKYWYPLTNVRYVFCRARTDDGGDFGLYITSPDDVATFAATEYIPGEFQQIFNLSRLNVLDSDRYALQEKSILHNEKYH